MWHRSDGLLFVTALTQPNQIVNPDIGGDGGELDANETIMMSSRPGLHNWPFVCRLQFCKQRLLGRTDAQATRQLARARTLNGNLARAVLERQHKTARISDSSL